MKFWDSSALIPLLVKETHSRSYADILKSDKGRMMVWWGSPIECVSAIARKVHERALTEEDATRAIARMEVLRDSWIEVEPSEAIRKHAVRILRNHDLRAGDALQLAAAWVATGDASPGTITILTVDERLRRAALRDGFDVMPSDSPNQLRER